MPLTGVLAERKGADGPFHREAMEPPAVVEAEGQPVQHAIEGQGAP